MKNYKFLFDLGNVFFDWNPKYYFKNIFKNNFEMKYFLAEICNENWNIKQDAGRSIKEAEIELIQKFPKYNNFIKLYYKNHRKMINGVFQTSVDILKELKKKNFKCYVLSNWSSETFIGMKEEYPFLYQFDDIMISGEEKLVKPDHKIFKLAIYRFDLVPENTIFIDDKIENIKSAEKLKFNTIHFTNQKKIKTKISDFVNLN